jgi:hypothetical protein
MPLASLFFMQAQKIYLRNNSERRFEHLLADTIRVPAHSLVWIKKGKEILYDGRMFDVEHYSCNAGIVVLTGHFDGDEDDIDRKISETQDDQPSKESRRGISGFVELFSGGFSSQTLLSGLCPDLISFFHPMKTEKVPVIFGTVPTPPPLG